MKIEIAKERFNTVHTQASFLPDGIVELRKIDKEQPDENTYLKLNEMVFHNGIIEVEVCGRLLPDAPDFARGFIGIVFRAKQMGKNAQTPCGRRTDASISPIPAIHSLTSASLA